MSKETFREYVFNPESPKCQSCQDLEEAVNDVDIYKMLFEPLAKREYERYLKLSRWGKVKYRFHNGWRRLRHKPAVRLPPIHPNCRCFIKEKELE